MNPHTSNVLRVKLAQLQPFVVVGNANSYQHSTGDSCQVTLFSEIMSPLRDIIHLVYPPVSVRQNGRKTHVSSKTSSSTIPIPLSDLGIGVDGDAHCILK